jgi:hypothetical protein
MIIEVDRCICVDVIEIGCLPGRPQRSRPLRLPSHRRASPVAKLLLRLAKQFGIQEDGAMRLTHDLTQEEIAQLVGASRETVNKVLIDFDRRRWIRADGKSLLITDSERLMHRTRLAAVHPAVAHRATHDPAGSSNRCTDRIRLPRPRRTCPPQRSGVKWRLLRQRA